MELEDEGRCGGVMLLRNPRDVPTQLVIPLVMFVYFRFLKIEKQA